MSDLEICPRCREVTPKGQRITLPRSGDTWLCDRIGCAGSRPRKVTRPALPSIDHLSPAQLRELRDWINERLNGGSK